MKGRLRPRPRIIENPTKEQLLKLFSKPYVTVDIETAPAEDEPVIEGVKPGFTGKQPTRAQLRLIGFGTAELGMSFRLRERPDLIPTARKLLANPKLHKVFQNGFWFDIPILEREGFAVRGPIDDTRDARKSLCSTSPLSLEYLASLYDDANAWKKDKDFDNLRYNATDAAETGRAWQAMVKEADWSSPRVQAIYELSKKKSRIAAEMHQNGMRVNEERRQWMAWALLQQHEEGMAALKAEVGIPSFRGTDNDMRALLYKRHEKGDLRMFSLPDPVDAERYTREDMRTISVKANHLILELVDPSCPPRLKRIVDLWWKAMEPRKARSTFITSAGVLQAIGPDGRLRPGWNSCGTDTYRFSCSGPNVMNLEQVMRAMYEAAPGHVLIHSDKSQLELRVMEAVAGDRTLHEFIQTGDVYSMDAKAFFKLPPEMNVKKMKPAARQQAKIIHLASQYAAGTTTVFQQALMQDRSLTYAAVNLLHREFKRTYADTVRYWGDENDLVLAQGYSNSRILDRRRVYPVPPGINEVANYPIQTTAADIMDLELVEIDEQLKKHWPSAKIINQLHDAIDIEAQERHAGAITRMLEEVQSRPYVIEGRERVFPVEIKCGQWWSDV